MKWFRRDEPEEAEKVVWLPIDNVHPNPHNPRDMFRTSDLELSIETRELYQPIIVRPHPKRKGHYETAIGDRRRLPHIRLGKKRIKAIIRDYTDNEMKEISVLENPIHQDVSPIRIAMYLDRLMKDNKWNQAQLAKRIGWSQAAVSYYISLLKLADRIKKALAKGEVSKGGLMHLATFPEDVQMKIFERIKTGMRTSRVIILAAMIRSGYKVDDALEFVENSRVCPKLNVKTSYIFSLGRTGKYSTKYIVSGKDLIEFVKKKGKKLVLGSEK